MATQEMEIDAAEKFPFSHILRTKKGEKINKAGIQLLRTGVSGVQKCCE